MTGLIVPPRSTTNGLERLAEEFYSRLNHGEPRAVRKIVDGLIKYMSSRGQDYLVAGVGGILRFTHPNMAKDIDLAVVGFKYPQRENHYFDHVVQFTVDLHKYFEELNRNLVLEFGLQSKGVHLDKAGSGPFEHTDKKYSLMAEGDEDAAATIETDMESFGWYDSKGLRACFEAIRPIDIQFVFNKTPEEWRADQRTLRERPGDENRKKISREFPYAILAP